MHTAAATRPVKLDPHRPLVDLLSDRGLKHRKPLTPTRNQWAREVVDQDGVVVFVGDCFEVVEWLCCVVRVRRQQVLVTIQCRQSEPSETPVEPSETPVEPSETQTAPCFTPTDSFTASPCRAVASPSPSSSPRRCVRDGMPKAVRP